MAVVGVKRDQDLEAIVWEIYLYLQNLGFRRFHRFLGKRRIERASASWTEVNIQLSHFVEDPKNNYSKLMSTIEHEKAKFNHNSPYVHHLAKLEDFLKQSPQFSNGYNCLVRVPDGFKKRKMKTKMEPKEY